MILLPDIFFLLVGLRATKENGVTVTTPPAASSSSATMIRELQTVSLQQQRPKLSVAVSQYFSVKPLRRIHRSRVNKLIE